jgi:hypothetical protein
MGHRTSSLVLTSSVISSIFQPFLLAAAPAGQTASTGQTQVAATGLVKSAERSLTETIQLAKACQDPALSPERASGKPFWQALKKLNAALDKTERGLSRKDATFFHGLGEALSAVF